MNIFSKPTDLTGPAQLAGIRALANVHGSLGPRVTITNVTDLEKKLRANLKNLETGGDSRPFFRSLVAEAGALEEISSSAWNDAQDRIYVDLYAIYQMLQESAQADAYAGALTREKFFQTKASILKVINEIRLYQFLKSNPEYQDGKFVDFNGSLNESDKRPLATIDPDVRLLELAVRSTDLHSRENFDMRSTSVSVSVMGGVPSGLSNDFAPSRMLDGNPDSFWADIVMADGSIAQEFHPSSDAGLGPKINVNGVIAHVVVSLSHVSIANNLKILPFGQYPIRIIDVAYKESIGQTHWMTLPGFRVEEPTLDWIEINFEPRTIAEVRITLHQPSYSLSLYHLPKSAVRNALLWQSVKDEKLNDTVFQIGLTDKNKSDLEISPSYISVLAADQDFKDALDGVDLPTKRESEYRLNLNLIEGAANALTQVAPGLQNRLLEPITGAKDIPNDENIEIRKYEYIYGIRSVELRHNLYQPLGHYSSPKFVSGATILDVSLETEERHPAFSDGLGSFQKTSTEWEIELGADRRYPIAPQNWRVVADSANEAIKAASDNPFTSTQINLQPFGSGIYSARPTGAGTFIVVPDEYLKFDRQTRTAVTRLPIGDLTTVLRRNGTRVRIGKYSVEKQQLVDPYANTTLEPNERSRVALSSVLQERGIITITDPEEYDPNAVYTLQYIARDDADVLQIDSRLNSTPLIDPEVFKETNRSQAIVLSRFPYVDYNIINLAPAEDVDSEFTSTGTSELARYKWVRDDKHEARWRFQPTLPNYKVGTIDVTNGSPNVVGAATQWLANIDSTEPNGFRVKGSSAIYKLQSVASNGLLLLNETYKGTTAATQEYVVGQYFESDGVLYAFDNMIYEPIRVYINNVKASNLTNYATFEHEAFTQIPKNGRQYQYIHAGNVLYFNAPISGAKIEVYYSWLTEYIRINSVLRCNIPVSTVLTPQVNSAMVKLRTSKL